MIFSNSRSNLKIHLPTNTYFEVLFTESLKYQPEVEQMLKSKLVLKQLNWIHILNLWASNFEMKLDANFLVSNAASKDIRKNF